MAGLHRPTNVGRSPESVFDALTARELLGLIDDELSRLPEDQRSAVLLCCLEGHQLEEAAGLLGCGVGAVKGRLERGRARLRERLGQRGVELPGAMAGLLLCEPPPAALVEAAAAGRASASAVALLKAGASMHLVKLAVLVGGLVLGGVVATRHNPAREAAAPPAPSEAVPEGARLRLGEAERRAFEARIAVTKDGRSIVGVSEEGRLSLEWDFRTGKLLHRRAINIPHHQWRLSPDGRWVGSVSDHEATDGKRGLTLVLWDARTGLPARRFPAKSEGSMPAFAFAPGGDRVAVVRYEAEKPLLDVWDVDTEKRLLAGRLDVKESCQQLLFSPDGKHVLLKLSPQAGDTLTCWPVAPGAKPLWTAKLGEWAKQILVTPRGKVLSAHHGRTLKERDLLTGAASESLRLPRVEGYHFLAVSSDDKLYEAQRDAVVEWDLTTGREARRFPGGWGPVLMAAGGKSLVVNPGSVQRWDLATGRPAFPDETPLGHFDSVTSIRFTADGKRLVSAARDGSVAVWDAAGGRPTRRWRAQVGRLPSVIGFTRRDRGGVQALAVSADGRRALTAGYDEGDPLRLWDTADGKELLSLAAPEAMTRGYLERVHSLRLGDGPTAFALLCSGSRGPGTEVTGRLMRWDLAAGKATADLPVERLVTWTSAVDPAGRRIATGDLVRDAGSGRVVARLAEHDAEAPPGVAFSPCGALLGGCPTWRSDHDRFARRPLSLQVWEPWTGQVVAQLPGPRIVGEVVFHPDGWHVAVNDWDGVHVYDLRSKKRVKSFPTQRPAFPETFAFSPDGRTLATGHPDGTILLWDVTLPKPTQEPARPDELEALWRDLGGDAATAYRAAWRLADLPREAVPFLRGRVKPAAPASKATTAALLRDLDADDRPTRDRASAALRALGHAAEPALRDARAKPASAEQKRRIDQLLAALPLTADEIRSLRAAAALGWAGTPDALAALRRLAGGTATDPLTRQAGASLASRAATVSR